MNKYADLRVHFTLTRIRMDIAQFLKGSVQLWKEELVQFQGVFVALSFVKEMTLYPSLLTVF
jgi:hypothetical protein